MRKGAGGSEVGKDEQRELLSHLTVVVKLQPELKTTTHSADTKDKKKGVEELSCMTSRKQTCSPSKYHG